MKCQKYTSEQLLTVIRSIKEHCMKLPVAAEKYNVPLSTLYDHTKEQVTKTGLKLSTHHPHQGGRKKIAVTVQVLQEMKFELMKEYRYP